MVVNLSVSVGAEARGPEEVLKKVLKQIKSQIVGKFLFGFLIMLMKILREFSRLFLIFPENLVGNLDNLEACICIGLGRAC